MSAIAWESAEAPYAVPARRRPHLVVVPAPAVAASAPALRLTARGRLVLLVVAVLAIASFLGVRGLGGAGAVEPLPTVTVEQGQTLSEVAAAQLPSMPISQGVLAIQLANDLSTAQVGAGQQLVIPQG